jgi:hypothetical protein
VAEKDLSEWTTNYFHLICDNGIAMASNNAILKLVSQSITKPWLLTKTLQHPVISILAKKETTSIIRNRTIKSFAFIVRSIK